MWLALGLVLAVAVAAAKDPSDPLYDAVIENNTEGALALIEQSEALGGESVVNLQHKITEKAALHHASANGHLETVEMLLSKGADPNLQGKGGSTPLTAAASDGHVDIIHALIAGGAGPNVFTSNSPLMFAVSQGHVDAVKTLLESGANPDIVNGKGRTALQFAAAQGHAEVATVLIDAGAKVDLQDSVYSKTALMVAAWQGQTKLVKLLLAAGARVDLTEEAGRTALQIAEEHNPNIAEILQEQETENLLAELKSELAREL